MVLLVEYAHVLTANDVQNVKLITYAVTQNTQSKRRLVSSALKRVSSADVICLYVVGTDGTDACLRGVFPGWYFKA